MANNLWQNIKREFLAFSRSDRNGILILASLIVLVLIANYFVKNLERENNADFSEIKAAIEKWERDKQVVPEVILFDFDPNTITKAKLDSLTIPTFIKQNLINYREAGGVYKTGSDLRKLYGMNDSIFSEIEGFIKIAPVKRAKKKQQQKQPETKVKELHGFFDPNSTSLNELQRFGFSKYQAQNLIRYREKGGYFSLASDLLKIYGVDSTFYLNIYPHIRIDNPEKELNNANDKTYVVELNSADSLSLMQLKGIGSVYAKRILKYRNLLGGFYTKEQLKEVYNLPEELYLQIEGSIKVDTARIAHIRINFANYTDLIRHPYLGKTEVQALLHYRETNGAFSDKTELTLVEGFDNELLAKILPYFSCR